jgi:transitional endoplasmic reticulum ATPase
MAEHAALSEKHLKAALEASGGQDRPLIQPVQWEDIIVEPGVEEELRLLVRQLKVNATSPLPVPTGVLLEGPPGTGKTMIARLLATQSARSFYPVTAADLLGSGQGESVKRLSSLFARAKEQSPSIIFFDELDGLFGTAHGLASSHDTQFTEQALIEISRIEPSHNVLLVGATNHRDRLDPRILRGGRFSEKISIRVPGPQNRARLLRKLLGDSELSVSLDRLVEDTAGMAPADIEAVVQTARRFAFGRSEHDDRIAPLTVEDFARAIDRVHPMRYDEPEPAVRHS